MVRVSVIIPTYNRAQVLPEALDSVLAQTFHNFEIIVVDDGSTDETEKAVARYGDQIRYLRQEHRGVAAARNIGLAAATAPYIAFLDSDDLWIPEKLAIQSAYLKEHSDCALLCSNFLVKQLEDNGWGPAQPAIKRKRSLRLSQQASIEELLADNFVSLCTALIRTNAARAVGGFDDSLKGMEDWDLSLRLATRYPIAFLDSNLAIARRYGDNLSKDKSTMFNGLIQVIRKAEQNPEMMTRWEPVLRSCSAEVYYRLGHRFFYLGEMDEARSHLRESLRRRRWQLKPWRYLALSYLPAPFLCRLRKLHARQRQRRASKRARRAT